MIARGAHVHALEQAVADQLGGCGTIACTSGTAALVLALKTLDIGTGDQVILPTYVCWNVLAAVTAIGATPRLCDVDESGVLTVQTVRPVLSARTRAIVAVHIFGHPCDILSLTSLGLPVIEDACQAFGLEISGVPAGTLGMFGVLSFHATKCLTTGEGGMLVIKNPNLLEQARAAARSAARNNAVGLTAMTDMQAALGLAQLKRYPSFLERRRQIFVAYHAAACSLKAARPGYLGDPTFLFRYTLRTHKGFESSQSALLLFGVQARLGVDELLHRRFSLDDRDYPGATSLFTQTISLPFHPSLNKLEQDQVIRAMQEVFDGT
jgi:UDP-4-amino-4-deoxy-L-arabinose-oxoglutarate aminotransferase